MLNKSIHDDLRQLSQGTVTARNFGRYDVNGFRFRSAKFEAKHPLAATTNTGVVTRACDAEGRESNYYGIIQDIIELKFGGSKDLRVTFFCCDWFDNTRGTRDSEFGIVEVKHEERLRGSDNYILAHQVELVYYVPYPCPKLKAWWVVYKVNPRERLFAPGDAGYRDTQLDEQDDVYQEDELPVSFNVQEGFGLDTLVGDAEDVTELDDIQVQGIRRKRRRKVTVARRNKVGRTCLSQETGHSDEF